MEIKKLSDLILQYKKILNSKKHLLNVISDELKLIKDKQSTSLFIELGEKTNRENLLKNVVEKIDDIIQKRIYQ